MFFFVSVSQERPARLRILRDAVAGRAWCGMNDAGMAGDQLDREPIDAPTSPDDADVDRDAGARIAVRHDAGALSATDRLTPGGTAVRTFEKGGKRRRADRRAVPS